jgi:hypothetical protein
VFWAVWVVAGVVLLAPVLDHDLCVGDKAELLDIQQLASEPPLKDSTNGFSHGDPGCGCRVNPGRGSDVILRDVRLPALGRARAVPPPTPPTGPPLPRAQDGPASFLSSDQRGGFSRPSRAQPVAFLSSLTISARAYNCASRGRSAISPSLQTACFALVACSGCWVCGVFYSVKLRLSVVGVAVVGV